MTYREIYIAKNMKKNKSRRYKFDVRKWVKPALLFLVLLAFSFGIFLYIKLTQRGGITVAQAAKMLTYACADTDKLETTQDGYWYDTYISYVNDNNLIKRKDANSYIKYEDLKTVINTYAKDKDEFQSILSKKGIIKHSDFIDFYMNIIKYMPNKEKISRIEAVLAGTPGNIDKAGEWLAYTTKGTYKFTGIILDDKIDKNLSLIVAENEILAVDRILSDDITYKNVWILNSASGSINVNIYGVERSFNITALSEQLSSVLADIEISKGTIKNISIKTDTIRGKVLLVTKEFVEIEGYGKVPLDEYFMIYDLNDGARVKTYNDIVVGYDLQDFIVANGMICGASISTPLKVGNIRVLLRNTGFKSIIHDNVTMTCNTPYKVIYGENEELHQAGEIMTFDRNNPVLAEQRIKFEPVDGGNLQVLSIKRSQGNPSYEGTIELSLFDNGIAIINEVDIERYLKRVVPSEMPASFGVEALKVQAVCARSYAYRQLTNSKYNSYGAHVDDSTQFQVYNNTVENTNANQAIKDTASKVLTYNGNVIETYYYSTSCGMNTDISLWGSSVSDYPYFKSRSISRSGYELNLCDETEFQNYIRATNNDDYDSQCSLYRWEIDQDIRTISDNFNSKLAAKYKSAPARILTLQSDGSYKSQSIASVGDITDIYVNTRVNGGAAISITVVGTAATVQVNSESLIRAMLGNDKVDLRATDGVRKMASLPSSFCIFTPLHDETHLIGFRITGGGYGHGIGMSQNAVNTMTKEGMDYVAVLKFFYEGTEVTTMTE